MPSTNRSTPGVSAGIADRLPKWLVPNLSGLNMVALFIALLLIGLLLVPVAQVMIVAFQDPATGAATCQGSLRYDCSCSPLSSSAVGISHCVRPAGSCE